MNKKVKKLLAVLMVISLMFALAACSSGGAGEKTVEGNVDKNVSAGGTLAASDKGVTSISGTTDNGSSSSKDSAVKLNGYAFVSNGVNVCIDDVAADTAEKLGTPEFEPFEAPSCAFDGITVTYSYKGFTFDTYDNNGTNCIFSIVLMNDQVSTAEGVKIGDSASKITEKYGEPTEQNESSMTYVKDNMQLLFILRDGVIDQIQYLTL